VTDLTAWNHDPRLTASIDARLTELVLMHTARDHRWVRTVLAVADDLVAHDQVPELLSAVCRLITDLACGCHGHQVAVARFTSDLRALRIAAFEEMAQ
jgi:hypothetical protein